MKKFIILIGFILSFLGIPAQADDFQLATNQAIAIEANTGQILYEKDSKTAVGIASITKLLTTYLVYEAIQNKQLTLDTEVDISDNAYNLTVNSSASNIPLESRKYTVQQLLEASLIASANSASIALAEKISGSEEQFVEQMKSKLNEWGITDATIINSTGLSRGILDENLSDDEKKSENKLSAYDVAIVAQHLIQDFPQVLDITKKPSFELDGETVSSYNLMLEGLLYYREGVDGLKTGTSDITGASFVAAATTNGIRVITVVLGVEGADEDSNVRFSVTNDLLNYIGQNFTSTTLIKKGEQIDNSQVKVLDGVKDSVNAVAQENFDLLIKNGEQVSPNFVFTATTSDLTAPIKKGSDLGTLTYENASDNGYNFLNGQTPSIKMIAAKTIESAPFYTIWWNHFVQFVNEKL